MLRSRTKSAPSNQSGSNELSEPETKYAFKKYGSTIGQITSLIIIIYIIYILYLYASKSENNALSEHDESADINLENMEEVIANELQNELENNDDDDDDVVDDDDDGDIAMDDYVNYDNDDNDIDTETKKEDEKNNINDDFLNLPKDSCQWRAENLVGTCFGLSFIRDIKSAIECKKECCDNYKCITWQYHPTKGCQNGGNVRFGLEHASTPNWCEPTKPREWKGKRIKNKNGDNGECEWNENILKTQCFGLGPEQSGIQTEEECAKLCCNGKEKECEVWQWRDDKGCFIGKSNNCDDDILSYIGQRKVMPPKESV